MTGVQEESLQEFREVFRVEFLEELLKLSLQESPECKLLLGILGEMYGGIPAEISSRITSGIASWRNLKRIFQKICSAISLGTLLGMPAGVATAIQESSWDSRSS